MALTGTLKDFGIADILQLIGQQQKTGVLHLRGADQAVDVHFVDGNVVKAESAHRSARDLLGAMMVRTGLLTGTQLDSALATQHRTLRRLGDVLVGEGLVTRETFREIYRLQTTETLYRLFRWKDGTYEFTQEEVDYDPEAITPIRSENVLMEGFRMVDEWPMVRRRIPSDEHTFRRLRELPPSPHDEVGAPERRVWALALPGVPVRTLIDRARLGEFETCKALYNLVEGGWLKVLPPQGAVRAATPAERAMAGVRRLAAQLAVGALAVAAVTAVAWMGQAAADARLRTYTPEPGRELLAAAQTARLREALEIHRLELGAHPEALEELVDVGLVTRAELAYPYGRQYFYKKADAWPDGYVLLPPVP